MNLLGFVNDLHMFVLLTHSIAIEIKRGEKNGTHVREWASKR